MFLWAARFVSELLRLLHFKSLGERGVAEDECGLFIALGVGDFALALFAAESHFDPADVNCFVSIQWTTGKRALALSGLASCSQLVIGLGCILGSVFREGTWAVTTAEVDLATFVVSGLVFQSRLAGNRAGRLEGLGLFFSGISNQANCQNSGTNDAQSGNGHVRNLSEFK